VQARAFRRMVRTTKPSPPSRGGPTSANAITSFARNAPNPSVRAANETSSVHLTLSRLETLVEGMAARLSRLEHSHGSLRRRIVAQKAQA
jgi:hypothetical protein